MAMMTGLGIGNARLMAPSYQGPLDIDGSAAAAYSHRALKSSWSANTVTIRRGTDNVTQSFGVVNHAVDAAAVAAFLGAATGYVASFSDQSGNAKHAVQATANLQPTWIASGNGGKPQINLFGKSAVVQSLVSAGNVDLPNSAVTAFMVIRPLDNGSDQLIVVTIGDEDNGPWFGVSYNCNGGNVNIESVKWGLDNLGWTEEQRSDVNIPMTGRTLPILVEIRTDKGATSEFLTNGKMMQSGSFVTRGTGLAVCTGQKLWMGGELTGNDWTNIGISELIIYPTKLSSQNAVAIRQNIAAYYGVTLIP